jgi:hypothetical protein
MPAPHKIVFSTALFEARLIDGREAMVRVRAMPARHMRRIVELSNDEAGLVEFVCLIPPGAGDKVPRDAAEWKSVPPGWAATLSDESFTGLVAAAQRLNFSRAETWAQRQVIAVRQAAIMKAYLGL